jgi:hypothetical protein
LWFAREFRPGQGERTSLPDGGDQFVKSTEEGGEDQRKCCGL